MKTNHVALLFFFLMLSAAVGQQINSSANARASMPVSELKSKAESGDVESQTELGVRYAKGDGVTNDFAEAVKWFRKAADQNCARAQFNLGVCYDEGNGVVTNKTEAVKWYRKAAQQDEVHAQFNLGNCYDNGEGVTQDKVQAAIWYHKAAELGDAAAQFNLGLCYESGEGVQKNFSEAMKWYNKAAAQGDADAKSAVEANRRGFGYYLTKTIVIVAFIPALILLTAPALAALRKHFGRKAPEL